MHNLDIVIKQFRLVEQSGKPPLLKMYKDHKGNHTIATGFNLVRKDAKKIFDKLGIKNFYNIKSGKQALSEAEGLKLENYVIEEVCKLCCIKLGTECFEKLNSKQQAAIMSLAMTPIMLGPNIIRQLKAEDFQSVYKEIKFRSNKHKHKGIQNRRNQEASLFLEGTKELTKANYTNQAKLQL